MTTEAQKDPVSFLDIPDDELEKYSPDSFAQAESDDAANADSAESEDAGTEPEQPAEVEAAGSEEGDATKPESTEEADSEEKPEAAEKPEAEKVEKPEESSIDYKAEYARLLAPFKANGRDISVKSVDDAITLMQMGANYNKKMAALKPNLALLKMLENNGLLSEEKISFLIDLEKKNPDAINKLIKDSGIDPMDIDADKASGYKPSAYKVDDRELELDVVLDEIQETPSYNRTLEIVSKEWDAKSKQTIANSPQLLKVINSHVQSGIYDLISKELESERVFGRLNGLSDIEAYRQVGDMIQARGGFDHLGRQGQQAAPQPVVVQPKPKVEDDAKIKEKKRAASSTKPAAASSAPKDFNPLSMSDEEFSKLIKSNYL